MAEQSEKERCSEAPERPGIYPICRITCMNNGENGGKLKKSAENNYWYLTLDIRGYTQTLSSNISGLARAFIDDFFFKACDIISLFKGHINKIIGDAIFAVFDPELDQDADLNIQRAASFILMEFKKMKRVNKYDVLFTNDKIKGLTLSINSGASFRGFVGHEIFYQDYSYIGHRVNILFRLSKYGHTDQILGSHNSYEELKKRFVYFPFGSTDTLPGVNEEVPLFWLVREITQTERDDKYYTCCPKCDSFDICKKEYEKGLSDSHSNSNSDKYLETNEKPLQLQYPYKSGYYYKKMLCCDNCSCESNSYDLFDRYCFLKDEVFKILRDRFKTQKKLSDGSISFG